jgi:1-acyl-sn-glycerol-3-phosphate acyltransferase
VSELTAETHNVPRRSFMYEVLQIVAGIGSRVFFDLKVKGLENLPKSGGVLVVSNHQSYLDPVILAVRLHRPFAYLADAKLFKFGPFAWLIRSLNAFPVKQGKGDVGAMKEVIRLLNEGWVLNVFPEGTRTANGELDEVQPGVALMIRRTNVPVVPAIIHGAFKSWPRHQLLPWPGKVRVMYGPPIDTNGLSGREIVGKLQATFTEMFAEVKAWSAQLETPSPEQPS